MPKMSICYLPKSESGSPFWVLTSLGSDWSNNVIWVVAKESFYNAKYPSTPVT